MSDSQGVMKLAQVSVACMEPVDNMILCPENLAMILS